MPLPLPLSEVETLLKRCTTFRIAEETGVWLAPRFRPTALPGHAVTELYVGDNLLALQDADVMPLFARMFALARAVAA